MTKWWISGWAVLALGGAAAMATPSYTAVFLPSGGFTGNYAMGIANNGQIVGYSQGADGALVWNNPYSQPVVLSPNTGSAALATDGTLVVGAEGNTAVVWEGMNSTVLAMPDGLSGGAAEATADGQIAGSGGGYAMLWPSADSVGINLNPPGFHGSIIYGADGTYEVGGGQDDQGNPYFSLVWTGSSNAAVELRPDLQLYAVSGGNAVGQLGLDAAIWNIPTGTLTNLGPGVAYAIAGNYEAGYTSFGPNHAVVWNGSANSAIDLNNYLPPGFASIAYGVDANGDVVGSVSDGSGYYAVEWIAPEPALLPLAISSLLIINYRRRQA